MKVKVYSTPSCPFCKMTKEFLKEKNISFEDINVAEDEKGREEMIKKSGAMSVPVISVEKNNEEKILIGFDQQKLREALED